MPCGCVASFFARLSLKPFASVISSASLRRGTGTSSEYDASCVSAVCKPAGGYGLHAIHTSTAVARQQ